MIPIYVTCDIFIRLFNFLWRLWPYLPSAPAFAKGCGIALQELYIQVSLRDWNFELCADQLLRNLLLRNGIYMILVLNHWPSMVDVIANSWMKFTILGLSFSWGGHLLYHTTLLLRGPGNEILLTSQGQETPIPFLKISCGCYESFPWLCFLFYIGY